MLNLMNRYLRAINLQLKGKRYCGTIGELIKLNGLIELKNLGIINEFGFGVSLVFHFFYFPHQRRDFVGSIGVDGQFFRGEKLDVQFYFLLICFICFCGFFFGKFSITEI